MPSKREQILAAITTKLAAVSGISGRVYRSQADPNPRELAPFITVEWSSEQSMPDAVQLLGRSLNVDVSVYTRGDVPDSLADPIMVDAHQRLVADPSLGGLAIDIQLDDASNEVIAADFPAAKVTHTYVVKYRHSYGNMTT